MRIVSLLPSATEIICALGLEADLVGVTHECDFPPQVKALPKATRTLIPHDATSREIDTLVREQLQTQQALYTLDLPALEALRPDLLVTQALCDVCAVAEAEVHEAVCLLPGNPRVLNLEPISLEEVLDTLRLVGSATGTEARAEVVVTALWERICAVEERTRLLSYDDKPGVVFLEWIDPPFSGGHWNPRLVQLAGGVNLAGPFGEPSVRLAWDDILAAQPEALFIACCGFDIERALADVPILRSQPGWEDLPAVVNGRVYLSDGNAYFSRPGPRLVDSLEILAHALHPDVHPLPRGLPAAIRLTA